MRLYFWLILLGAAIIIDKFKVKICYIFPSLLFKQVLKATCKF